MHLVLIFWQKKGLQIWYTVFDKYSRAHLYLQHIVHNKDMNLYQKYFNLFLCLKLPKWFDFSEDTCKKWQCIRNFSHPRYNFRSGNCRKLLFLTSRTSFTKEPSFRTFLPDCPFGLPWISQVQEVLALCEFHYCIF